MTRKPLADIIAEGEGHALRKTLGPVSLTAVGIRCIIGAGIFVLTGTAAARYAGPGIMLSFVIGGIVCALVGLCYAELAALLPVAGSTYTLIPTPRSVRFLPSCGASTGYSRLDRGG